MTAWIHVPYWWHATILEVSWLATGIVSVVLTTMNLFDSWKDKASLVLLRDDPSVHRRHYDMVKLAAKGRVSSQLARLAISLLILFTGIIGVVQANPLGGRTTWTGLTVTLCLVGIGALTAIRSWADYRQRNLLYEMAMNRTRVLAAIKLAAIEENEPQ